MSKTTTLKLKFALLAILPALLAGVWFWLETWHHQQALAVSTQLAPSEVLATEAEVQYIEGKPVYIHVNNQGIHLQIVDGVYSQTTGEWSLSADKAHFATISHKANNQTGNTFVYGHNSAQVFQRLTNLKTGDAVYIVTDNGYKFTYKYRRSIDVTPRDTAIFSYQGPAILTLQTCSGLWDQTRQLLTFDFIKVEKS